MASTQKVKFGGTTLATQFFDIEEGAPDMQILRRKQSGIVGELEQLLGLGGSDVSIPIRLSAKTKKDLRSGMRDVYQQIGKHDVLTVIYNTSAQRSVGEEKIGKVTFQQVVVAKKPRYFAFASELNGPGWDCILMLIFRKLNPDD